MRFVILGAGAVGGAIGGRLHQHGHSALLIARGANYEAIRDRGLRLESPDETVTITVPVVEHPARVSWTKDDVLFLATKTQDTQAALDTLASVAPPGLPIFCAQNGVANERMANERFAHVYGVFVWCPADYLTPGLVQVWCAPKSGILHVGRYPSGSDATAQDVAAALRESSFYADAKTDIMRWKYRKLLSLGNAVRLCAASPQQQTARGRGAKRSRPRPASNMSQTMRKMPSGSSGKCRCERSMAWNAVADRRGRAWSAASAQSRRTT
jgi:2-dehydropantoate 2-reductase